MGGARDSRVSGLRQTAANAVWVLHMGVVALVVTSWMWPAASLWWGMLVLAPIMHLQWRLNDGACLLTDLEHFLRGASSPATESEEVAQTTFVGRALEPIVGPLAPAAVDRICYGLLWTSFTACALRLAAQGI